MAIKLQDWGMIPTPARQAVMRSEGIEAVARANNRLGESVGQAIESTKPYGKMLDDIIQAGEIADIAKNVQEIVKETTSNLGAKDVDNWQHNWGKETQPRVNKLLEQYPAATRVVGSKLAEAMTNRASLEAKRNTELSRVQESQDKWTERLTHSEGAGDEQQCELWLQAGKGSFFPESEYEQRQAESKSRCKLNRWQNNLDNSPLVTLADLESADESSLPTEKEDKKRFNHKRERVNQGVRSEMGELFISHMREGVEMEPQQLELARRAKIITAQQYNQAMATTPKSSPPFEFCQWMKNIDELDSQDEEQTTQLQLELGTANFPIKDKQALLRRMDQLKDVTLSDRRNLSRQIWGLYNQGYLGARDDTSSLRRLRRLQEEGLEHLRVAGAEDTAQWIQNRKEKANSWICFNPNPKKEQQDT